MINKDAANIISGAFDQLGELGYEHALNYLNGKDSSPRSKELLRKGVSIIDIFTILKNRVEYDDEGNVIALYRLTEAEFDSFLNCLISLTGLQDISAYPILSFKGKPRDIIIGQRGPQGLPGVDGTNANIVVDSDDNSVIITETIVGAVKTYDLSVNFYEEFTVSATPVLQRYEEGNLIASQELVITVNKGSKNITAVTIIGNSSLNSALQSALNLAAINDGSNPSTTIAVTNLVSDLTVTFEVTDGTTTKQVQTVIDFRFPFIYGVSDSVLSGINLYTNSSKLIQDQIDTTVLFNGTDKYFYFGFHGTYPDLDKIRDGNDDIVNADFNKSTISVTSTGLNNNWTENFTVYYTKVKADISSQEYKFEF